MIEDSFFNHSPECLVISDFNGKILQFNNSFKKLFEKIDVGMFLENLCFIAGGEKNVFSFGMREYFEFNFDNREITYKNETGYTLHFLLSARKITFRDKLSLLLSFKNITDFVGYKTVFEDLYNNLTYKTNELDKVIREKEETYQLLKEKDDELNRQLVLAGEIQNSLFPEEEQVIDNYTIASVLHPATVVSGDFFSIWKKDNHSINILIADVTGHGVPSALITMLLKMSLETAIKNDGTPEQILLDLNNDLFKFLSDASIFVTLLLTSIDIDSGKVKVLNCGHIPPLVIRARGELEEIEVNGMMLGVMDKLDYEVVETLLEKEDKLVIFTDGIPEAQDESGKFYENFFLERLKEKRDTAPKPLIDFITHDIYEFARKETLNDDITIICVERNE